MQLKPVKNYKKPVYAAAAAAMLAASGIMTGCETEGLVNVEGEYRIEETTEPTEGTETETSELMLEGDIAVEESP